MSLSVEQRYIKFGDPDSIERYLEERCQTLPYLKEKGVLHLIAKDFAYETISTEFGDFPFHNKLVLILTDCGLNSSTNDLTIYTIMPILTSCLKEFKQLQNNPQIPQPNRLYGVALAVIGISLFVFATFSLRTT